MSSRDEHLDDDVAAEPADPGLTARLSRRSGVAIGALALVVIAAGATWYAATPPDLATSTTAIEASTPVGEPVYLGVVVTGPDFDRTLQIAGVKVHTTSTTDVEVVPLLCRGGSIGVTTEPESFCAELVDPEGETFTAGDTIVLQVSADEPTTADVDRVRLAFREGLRWGTLAAGAPAVIQVLPR